MKRTMLMAVIAGTLCAAPIAAQSTKPQPAPTSKAATDAGAVPASDTAFAKEAAIGGMAEVEFGNLAKEKASNSDVKQFADRMVTDHSKGNDELKQWAQQKKVTLPTELDAKHKATKDRLSKLSGDAFDKAYMRDMVSDHVKDVSAFKRESTSAKDPELKAWAAKTLPTLEEHLKLARETDAKLTKTSTSQQK
jgi:putative membrane protein